MSEGIEDINVQLIEFGGENGVQALVKLDKTYRITISNEEIQNSMKDIVPSLTDDESLSEDILADELENTPIDENNASPEQDAVIEENTEMNEETNPDDNTLQKLKSSIEELQNNFEEESQSQLGGQSLDQVSIAVAVALLNNELDNKVKNDVDSFQDDNFMQSNNASISNILENGQKFLSIQSIEEINTKEIENHLETIENEIKDKDFPKTQKSIEDVKETIQLINMKNDMSNV